MIEIRQKPGEFVWEIDQRFKRLKGKLKYLMNEMQHQTLVCQFTTPTIKISIVTTKISDPGRGSAGSLATGRKPVPANRPSYRRTEGGFE
jgi:hypothetical protein